MDSSKHKVTVVGAGLAGSECALQLAEMGIDVTLYEMRGVQMSEAHRTDHCAELVCSNSFGSLAEVSAPGQLKREAQGLNSHILKAAFLAQVPAGQALGMDRDIFAQTVTQWIEAHPRIELKRTPIASLDEIPRPAVIATGPLTSPQLSESLKSHFGNDFLYFFDAIAPIIDADSINTDIVWKADRYDKGTKDYYNCPLDKDQYLHLIDEISKAGKVEPKEFEKTPFFEGCMPIETMVARGPQTPRFGPMKPVGLINPRTQKEAYAVVQLRQDNREGTAFNMVGFQTRMTYSEQKRVFRLIPGLEQAEFLKLGSIHRNLFINTPRCLNKNLSSQKDPELFFAGQITGVEGYFESTCIGIAVAHFVKARLEETTWAIPRETAFGSLLESITDSTRAEHFQPTNINFSLFPKLTQKIRDKQEKKRQQIQSADLAFKSWRTKAPPPEMNFEASQVY